MPKLVVDAMRHRDKLFLMPVDEKQFSVSRKTSKGNYCGQHLGRKLVFLFSAINFACFHLACPVVAAATEELTLQVIPSSVEVERGQEVKVLVVVDNLSTNSLHEARLSSFANVPIEAAIEPVQKEIVAPNGSFAWTAGVSNIGQGPLSGNIYFRLDYDRLSQGQGSPTPRTVVVPLAVTNPSPEEADRVAEVQVKSTLQSLNEKRPGSVFLVIRNKADVPISIAPIAVISPSNVTVNIQGVPALRGGSQPIVLAPHDSRIIEAQVKAESQVTPGKLLLLFKVPIHWNRAGLKREATVVASQEIDVGIFGETAIMTALGVPSFLFLPGFLMVATFGLLWKLGQPVALRDNFPLKVNTTDFYLIAITLSILTCLAYPWATKTFLHDRRNYLEPVPKVAVLQ